MRRWHPDVVAASTLVLLPVLVLGRALWPGRVLSPADILLVNPPWAALEPGWQPANPLLTDVALMFHPWLLHAAREVTAGRFPLWNPHEFTGAPFFANPQTALLFPLTWLAFVLPAPAAIALGAMGRLALAGLGTFAFVRLLGVASLPALIGAVTYMFSAVLVVWLHWSLGTALAVLPLLLAATEYLRARTGGPRIAALSLVVALALFAGYPQIAALGTATAAAWALVRARSADRPAGFLLAWALGAGLGLALAAVQVLPFLEYLRESAVLAARTRWMPVMAAPPRTAITLWLPGYYGSPLARDFWGYWNFNEVASSAGPVPWILAPVALLGAWSRAAPRFFLGLALVGLAVAYEIPGLTALLVSIPPLSYVIAFRAVGLVALALSVLCALGADVLLAGPAQTRRVGLGVRLTFSGVVILVLALLARDARTWSGLEVSPPVPVQYLVLLGLLVPTVVLVLARLGGRTAAPVAPALLGLQLAALLPLALTWNPVIETRHFYPPSPPALRHVQSAVKTRPGRVLLAATPNVAMLLGLDEAAGDDGLTPRRVRELAHPRTEGALDLTASGALLVTADPGSPAFDLLGIRYVVTSPGEAAPGPHFAEAYAGRDGRVWENPHALPRAFLVGHARCADDATALRLLHRGPFDPRALVLLAGCEAAAAPGAPGGTGLARVAVAAPDRVVVEVEAAGPAYLVLADTWFPGWHVRVDGAVRSMWRADHAFRAVLVGAGRHEVEFRYAPRSVRVGLAVSVGAALGIVLLALFWRRRRA